MQRILSRDKYEQYPQARWIRGWFRFTNGPDRGRRCWYDGSLDDFKTQLDPAVAGYTFIGIFSKSPPMRRRRRVLARVQLMRPIRWINDGHTKRHELILCRVAGRFSSCHNRHLFFAGGL
ncbi:hypothetical protein EVAR_51163_1 [Eumeta japonica]|uniref:Uncharacterized protein n=1 Tax=Eumeta variegata TaxID=151549 RepID=A0A4C1XAZ4_EUMVA|nr:hypothetical protein EVAR_51163_1 [Eumeta japonica]